MEFSRQEYWSGLPFPSPGDLPNPGIKPGPPALRADTLPSESPGQPLPKHLLQSAAGLLKLLITALRLKSEPLVYDLSL